MELHFQFQPAFRLWCLPTYVKCGAPFALKQAQGVITTDFSMYVDLPRAVQIYNCYRNRALTKLLQDEGVTVIPAVGWSDATSFEFCFDGIPYGTAVAISSNGALKSPQAKELFLNGYKRLIEVINPCQVFLIGSCPKELQDDARIKNLQSFNQKFAILKQKE